MTALLLALWRVVGVRGIIVAGVIAFGAWWHLARVSEAYDRGAQVVRIEWQESRRREELASLERQKKQQAEINEAEAALLNERMQASTRIRALEEAIEQERAENEKNGVDLSACRLSDRMRDQLLYNRP